MLRSFYRCLLRLHPSGFRKRFADEMLSIFDHSAGKPAAVRLLMDGVVSLARQWTLRPEFWREVAAAQPAACDSVPSFCTLDPFRPRTGAVIQGLLLSAVLFFLTCFAIRYSWIHVLHVRIPEAPRESQLPIRPASSDSASTGVAGPAVAVRSEGNPPLSPSVALRASHNAPVQPTPPAVATQDRTVQSPSAHSSTAGSPQSQATFGARPAMEGSGAGHPERRLASKSDRTNHPQSNPLPDQSGNAQVEVQQAKPQDATGTSAVIPVTPRDVKPDAATLDAAERQVVVNGAIANLTKYYVNPDLGSQMADALRAHEKNGDDDAATDGEAFAVLLTQQMRDLSHDRYLMMVYSAVPNPENPPAPSPEEVALYRKEMERTNCSIEKAEILPHNIGYLKFNRFPDASICGTRVAAAMASLNHADAIIFDLRDNPGGYANMVALIATYLFDRPTHLNDFYNRGENSTEQSWTLPPVPGNRLADKPVFVLTSNSTFSAAEGFSYDLKMLKRATLVGETTSGRGHMGMGHRIDDHFTIRVPGVKVINPISNTNWEGTGVEPDVKVRSAEALKTAQKLAEKKLQQN
jgi:Peptidase family S41/N-terminal domain of Peptidase_S41 in eukaryotic IRBP